MAEVSKNPSGSEQSASTSTPTLKEMQQKLDAVERTTGSSGAVPNARKRDLLDASAAQAANPDRRLRWGTLTNKEKMEGRKADGYEVVPASAGGKQVGNMVLLAISREEYDNRVRAQLEENERRLVQHNREVENVASEVAKILRDRYGLRISEKDIIVRG